MITLITGPMKSGKSTEMYRQMERKHIAGKKILYIGPNQDDREFYARGIPRRKLFEVAMVNVVEDWNDLNEAELDIYVSAYDAIFVDEFFMIKNNIRLCRTLAKDNRKCDIFFGGLLADAHAEIWPEAASILPYCDNIIKLSAVCEECHSEHANYSYIGNIKSGEIVIGDSCYKSLCRKCFLKESTK